jgi:nicotinamidase-related amidase
MTLIEFPRKRKTIGASMLLMVDVQNEYASQDRPFSVPGLAPCLHNCRELLATARAVGMPVAHFRQLQNGAFFNETSRYSHWIEGFQPRPSERVYERSLLSCYHNGIFADYMDRIETPVLYLAGLSTDRACLATVMDAVHRRHAVCFVEDAWAARPIGQWSAGMSHAFLGDLIAQYCPVVTTQDAVDQFKHADPTRWEAFGG